MRPLLPGLLRVILRGRLAQDQGFALLLAERLPRPTDPIDHLLAMANLGAPDQGADLDPVVFETLGLEPELNGRTIPAASPPLSLRA